MNDRSKNVTLAEDRTDLAEDRTVLANERTFAGWMRTGLASIGIGVGFSALFGRMEPGWLARAIATLFILTGIGIFYMAQRNGCLVLSRLDSHEIRPVRGMNLRIVASVMSIGALLLVVGLWTMEAVL